MTGTTNGASPSTTKTIKLGGIELELELPYSEGHVLTAGEAVHLNQTYGENVGNNFRKDVETMLADGKDATEIQTAFDEYVEKYEMGSRKGSGPRKDPVEREMRSLAKKALQDAFIKKGYSWKETSDEEKEAKIAAYLSKYGDQVRTAAVSRLDTAKAVANAADILS